MITTATKKELAGLLKVEKVLCKILLCELLSVSEAAKFLNVSISTIKRWDDAGKLKSVRHPMNNYRKYHLKDLKEVISKLAGE